MKAIIYSLIFLLFNCKMSKTEDVNLVLTNIEINKKSVIKFKIENLSNANYFLPLSRLTFENNFDDKDLYNCIFYL